MLPACNFLSEPVLSRFQFLSITSPILGESYHLTTFLLLYGVLFKVIGCGFFSMQSLSIGKLDMLPAFASHYEDKYSTLSLHGGSLYELYFEFVVVPICLWTFF